MYEGIYKVCNGEIYEMIKKFKYFLWSNPKTKFFYRFLWYWKNENFRIALDYLKNPEVYDGKISSSIKKSNSNKNSLKSNCTNQPLYSVFPIINSVWRMEGASSQVLEHLSFYEKSFWCWDTIDHRLWLIYICCLLEKGEREHAVFLLHRYISKFNEKDIERFLPAANLAYELGIKNKNIHKAYTVFQALEKEDIKSKVSEIIKGKTVAVVGNGPFELNTGNGKEIDSHDIVIRFNNYPTIGYQKDYGSKTDIWVRGGSLSVKDRPNIDQFKLVIWEPDFWHISVQYNHLDILYRDVIKCKEKITYLSNKPQWNIFEKTQNANPTTGFFILWLLKEIRGNFKNIDVYGMSFPYENSSEYGHYYDQLSVMSTAHTMFAEEKYLRKLFYENGGTVPSRERIIVRQENDVKTFAPQLFNQIPRPKIYAIAYRKYDESKGRTGGPGGVLATQKRLFGNIYKGVQIEYKFESDSFKFTDDVKKEFNKYSVKLSCNLYANEYVLNEKDISEDINQNTDMLFICHDIGSAYGAFNSGKKYVLIYHQQGSLVSEAQAFGEELSDMEIQMMNDIEDVVFHNAQAVYFPSNGAKEEFVRTSKINCSGINFAGCLYNTVPSVYTRDRISKVRRKYHISEKRNIGCEIFLTVADFNVAKGVDRVPEFLNEYVNKSGKKVLWIAAGNATSSGIFEMLEQNKSKWNFNSILIGKRISHNEVLALMEICDFYIMLHRKSIFDIATLEAMRAGLIPVLSNTGGNPEFNKDNNVILVNEGNYTSAIEKLKNVTISDWKEHNKQVFSSYFSENNFYQEYSNMLDKEMKKAGISLRVESKINYQNLKKFKNAFEGKTVVICGGGESLSGYVPINNAIHIALNRALFCSKIDFDYLFMQDIPSEGIDKFNSYPCDKFYGIITNPDFISFGFKEMITENCNGSVFRYELAPRFFNHNVDLFEFELDKYCLCDAQSVLFSALQFSVYAGFKNINLVGVDFSNTNFDMKENKSKYANNVVDNLLAFKKQLHDYDESIALNVISTTNPIIENAFSKYSQPIITVTGIYTQNYESVVNLQKKSCKDNYLFDYRFITDDEWEKARTSNEFAFFGGNTIKTQCVIDKIKQYWGKLLLVCDADVVFLKKTQESLCELLGENDMIFLRERENRNNPYEKTPLNINIGFVFMRCNDRALHFWEEVQNRTRKKCGWDQEEANLLLQETPNIIRWALLPTTYLNGNDIKAKNLMQQHICTGCGTVAKRLGLSKDEYLKRIMAMAEGKESVWFDGTKII
jgi:glycosyltransferase involved in cell wall biosynthesis